MGTRFLADCLTADGGAKMMDESDAPDSLLPFFALDAVEGFLADFLAFMAFMVSMPATLLSMAVSTVALTSAS